MTYRILVTGSRTWTDLDAVFDALDRAIEATDDKEIVVVHGDAALGADRIAAAYCESGLYAERLGKTLKAEPHPANWREVGIGAGYRRNGEMVELGANVCLAFIAPCDKPKCRKPKPHGSHGATHCADLAEKAGIETRRYRP